MVATTPAWIPALPSDDEEEDGGQTRRFPPSALPEPEFYIVEDDDVQVLNVLKHQQPRRPLPGAEAAGHFGWPIPVSVGASNLPHREHNFNFGGRVCHFAATPAPIHHHREHIEISPWKRRNSEAGQYGRILPANFDLQSGSNVDGELYDTFVGSQPRTQGFVGGPASEWAKWGIAARGSVSQAREHGMHAGLRPPLQFAEQGLLAREPTAAALGSERMLMDHQAHMNRRRDVQEQFSNSVRSRVREHGILGGGPPSQLRRRGMLAGSSERQFREQRLVVPEDVSTGGCDRFFLSQVDNHGRYLSQEHYNSVGAPELRVQGFLRTAPPCSLEKMLTGNTMSEWWSSLEASVGTELSSLHWDILRFCKAYELTNEQMQARMEALEYVRHVVHEIWPSAEVHLFGSTATGLALPWSDIDVVVMSSSSEENSAPAKWQSLLCKRLRRHGQYQSLKLIVHTKVPLLKVVFKSGIACDICFDAHNGPRGVPLIRQFMQQYEALRPLCLVLKFFLGQQSLNELYTGGLGSFCLISMVVSHLQKLGVSGGGHDLGALLLSFFTRYTSIHNYRTDVVSTRPFLCSSKQAKGWVNGKEPELLAVEDPLDPSSDIAKGSYRIQVVRTEFLKAQRLLLTHWHQENVLARLVDTSGNPNQRPKPQGEKLQRAKQPKQKKTKKRKKGDIGGGDQEDDQPLQVRKKQRGPYSEKGNDFGAKSSKKAGKKLKNRKKEKKHKKKRAAGMEHQIDRKFTEFEDLLSSPIVRRSASKKRKAGFGCKV